ncbi:hypothetical protein [Aminobacter sp. MET-1]|uniref:hypothetical protein n=1 Tax=Aminobacter sp. MET-1 TaxID=2951085 RepID=UPI00226A842A|nr:hypothetical protein [Aminobacter sp. MET-1]MCX8571095.1 hypothetical protein [Aminobacter sp. MET-1]MCX8573236.1 hypothetical protein [Aminobacter sp. MET-1]
MLEEIVPDTFALQLADLSSQRRHVGGLGELSRREKQVVEMMISRPTGQKRKEVYLKMAEVYEIEVSSAERYFKNAIRKMRKQGHSVGDI